VRFARPVPDFMPLSMNRHSPRFILVQLRQTKQRSMRYWVREVTT
jgi:hypothetical protein